MTWEQAWQEGRTRWDAGGPAPALLALLAPTTRGPAFPCRLDELAGYSLPPSSEPTAISTADSGAANHIRVLVPGAGAGYDVLALAAPQRQVIGIDLAPSAKARFDALHGQNADEQTGIAYWVADFFDLADDPRWAGPVDVVWDYTFFCALDPAQRSAWARAMARLIRPGGVLITLMFPLIEDPSSGPAIDRNQGPPFPLTEAIYAEHLLANDSAGAAAFSLEARWDVEHSHPGREGKEALAIWRRNR